MAALSTTPASGGANPQAGRRGARRKLSRPVVLVAPIAIYFAAFFLYPVARLLVLSVWDNGPTIAPFGEILSDREYATVLGTTASISIGVTVVTLLLAYPVAIYLARLSGWLLALGTLMVVFPLLTSVLVRSFAWIAILGRQGIVNEALAALGLIEQPLKLLFNRLGVYIGLVHISLPLAVLTMYGVIKRIDGRLLKAAETLGASPLRVFLHVFMPLSAPGIAAAGLLVFIGSASAYITPALLGGPQDTMVAALIGDQIQEALNWSLGAALSVVLLVVAIAVFVAYFFVTSKAPGGSERT